MTITALRSALNVSAFALLALLPVESHAQKAGPTAADLETVSRNINAQPDLQHALGDAASKKDSAAAASILRANGLSEAKRVDFKFEGPTPKLMAGVCYKVIRVEPLGDGWYLVTLRPIRCPK